MGLSAWIGRVAGDGPVPLFAVAGAGARDNVQDLRLRPELTSLDSPAPASILLVTGGVPETFELPLARVHDALSHPRATLFWRATGPGASSLLSRSGASIVDGDPVDAAVAAYRELVTGRRGSEAPILPDVDPAPWRGVGPYGQGGSGMTGGVPYGRPMAELGPDPDGLRLDVLPVSVGPVFPRFPAGLVLDVKWAGDLVLDAAVSIDRFDGVDAVVRRDLQPFFTALREPVPIAELEVARAREHLRWLSDALLAQGLSALAARALRLALHVRPGDGAGVRRLERLASRTQVLRWSTRNVGVLGPEPVAGLGLGPIARAAGVAEDVRLEDPAYRELGFEPVLGARGDAAARWSVRLREAAQSLDLAARAGGLRTRMVGRVESPAGRLEEGSAPADRILPLIPPVVREREWGDVVTTLVSFDLDVEASALTTRAVAGAAA